MPTLEEIRARFPSDHYAIEVTGIAIQDAQAGKYVFFHAGFSFPG